MTIPGDNPGDNAGPHGVPTCYRHPDRETYIHCQRCARPICPDCMREASVGYQCPECVAEGNKSMRQPRAPYGGGRSRNPALTSIVLIGLNAATWLAIFLTGWKGSELIYRLALTPVGACGSAANSDMYYQQAVNENLCDRGTGGDGVWHSGVADGAAWQLITNAFTHVEVLHIAANMLALWFLGPQLEAVFGRARFLAVYLVSALAGSTAVYLLSDVTSQTVGASGAIFGMLGALLVVVLKVGGDVQTLLIWLGINAVITFAVPGISWQGHVGGFIGGLAVAAILVFAPSAHRTLVQVVGIGVFVAALLAVCSAQTLVLLS